ncbi:hypothetical protein ACQ5SK_22935 [Bradyrhizobium japonicum]
MAALAHDEARYSPELSSFELRATISTARLRRDQGRRNEDLREFLAPVYGWFTEGFDTHDLSGAKALLEEFATPQVERAWSDAETAMSDPDEQR